MNSGFISARAVTSLRSFLRNIVTVILKTDNFSYYLRNIEISATSKYSDVLNQYGVFPVNLNKFHLRMVIFNIMY
jgi:hypothetical protein